MAHVGTIGALGFLAFAVLAFTGGWSGELILDGPGVSMWLRLLLRHWNAGHGVPSWIPDMWAGTPMWDLVGAFHLMFLMPLAALVGPEAAVKLGVVGAQITGAWGAFVLARSLWKLTFPPIVAGLLYGLHPLFVSHGTFAGQEPSVWVFAVVPWLVWALRLALRLSGPRYIALAGLLVGFAILQQAEYAYLLVLLCGCLVSIEMARARTRGSGPRGPRGVMIRAGAVAAIGFGVCAHWLFPFATMSKSFVLTTPEDVRAGLDFLAGGLARKPGAFLTRIDPVHGTFDFFHRLIPQMLEVNGAYASGFYLSVVCLVPTLVAIAWLARHPEEDGTLSTIFLVSAIGIWMSMGRIPLASGGIAEGGRVVSLLVIGALGGVLVGNVLRHLELGRRAFVAAVFAAVFLFVVPYVSPLAAMQKAIPLLGQIRFPRLYPAAALGGALGAAYPITLVQRWMSVRPRLVPLAWASLCLTLGAAFLIDVHPYRSFYDLTRPDGRVAYREMADTLAASRWDFRVATEAFPDPQVVSTLLQTGNALSVGWPHPGASKDLWRLTTEVLENAPRGFRDAALGLSATAFRVTPRFGEEAERMTVDTVDVEPNVRVLPMVRSYREAVVIDDPALAPELAVILSGRSVGVVRGGTAATNALGDAATGAVGSDPCSPDMARLEPELAGDVAAACSLHNWVGLRTGQTAVALSSEVGGEFLSPLPGLRGITVWLDRLPGSTELVLRELEPDGHSPGPVVASTRADGIDENAMARFSFGPLAGSAGRRYAFELSCPGCPADEEPNMVAAAEPRIGASLRLANRLDPNRGAAFSLVYDRLPPASPSIASLTATQPGPGRWKIAVSGAEPSLVVVAETYFAGWRAKVDGRAVPVLEADGAFLGVPVAAGQHEITLEYQRSARVQVGRVITVATLLGCVVLLLAPNRPAARGRRTRRLRDDRSGRGYDDREEVPSCSVPRRKAHA